jgi:hypothetical protein
MPHLLPSSGITALATLAAVTTLATGCTDEAPAEPTWAEVSPILAAHCVRCHGAPAIGGAPATFRLDRYDDLVTLAPDGAPRRVLGAAAMAEWIADRTADGSMPPRFPFAQHDRDLLDNWFANRLPAAEGGPPLPLRGPAAPQNRPPAFTLTSRPAAPPATGLELAYELRDPDRDLVTGQLVALGPPGEPVPLGELFAGRGTLALDTALLPAGRYDLTATLDDGPGPTSRLAGQLDLVPPSPAPPRLTLLAPEQGAYVAAAELPLTVEVIARDADSPELTLTLTLLDDRATPIALATSSTRVAAGSRTRLSIGDAQLPAGLGYRVTAEISDSTAAARAESGRFRVSRQATADTFQTIADDILGPYCLRCHASSPRVPNLGIDLSRYRGTAGSPGAFDLRRRIFHRAVISQDMPPGSARRDGNALPEEERARLAAWLLAGAPEVSP